MLSLSPFKLIAAIMLLVGMKWLADWHLEPNANHRVDNHGV